MEKRKKPRYPTPAQREEAHILFLKGDMTNEEIAQKLGVVKSAVSNWAKRQGWNKERAALVEQVRTEAAPDILERLKAGLEQNNDNLLRLTACVRMRIAKIEEKLQSPEEHKVTNLDLQFVSNTVARINDSLEKMINRYSGVATDGNSIEFSASSSMKINLERLSDEELSRLRSLQTEVRGIIERAVKQPAKPIECTSERSGG